MGGREKGKDTYLRAEHGMSPAQHSPAEQRGEERSGAGEQEHMEKGEQETKQKGWISAWEEGARL